MRASKQHIDMFLFFIVFVLMFAGIGLVFSSTIYIADLRYNSVAYYLKRHILRVLWGLFLIIFISALIDYRKLRDYAFYIFVANLVLLALTPILSSEPTPRWLKIGPLSIQTSEFAKIALLIYLSYLIEKNQSKISSFKFGFLPLFSVVLLTVLLVLFQKSFTMAFLIFSSGVILLYLGGVKLKHLVLGLLGGGIPLMGLFVMIEPYRIKRILSHLNPEAVGMDLKYQVFQSLIGLGNGGLFGVGIGHSRQRELFLPLAYNDYIFSIVGEEYGFFGSFALIFAFVLFFWRGIRISRYVTDEFGKLLASGITFLIFLTAVIHIGVTLGILFPTGIPLPFVSYGGSAMTTNCIAVGILLSISKQTITSK